MLIDREETEFTVERCWFCALKYAVVDSEVINGSLMAGQSAGLVGDTQPLKEVVDEMVSDAEQELQRLKQIFSGKDHNIFLTGESNGGQSFYKTALQRRSGGQSLDHAQRFP